MDTKAYWVGFNMVKGVGAVRFRALMDYFGSLEIAWQAPADVLRSAGLTEKVVENLLQLRRGVNLEHIWERLQALNIQVLTWDDEVYPRYLKEISQPPPILYVRGSICREDEWAVSIVGTRRMTAYGRHVADELAALLAHNGITVVSGLARGVDATAHQSALNAGGRTLAVLGSGVDQVYPPEHRALAEHIIQQGALLSDYAPGTPPDSVNFPPRNRIISGLSRATVVVEAGEKSGALITASFAAEQGREVFAVPGNITGPQSVGTNRLIQQGARLLLRVDEVLEVLNLEKNQEQQQVRKAIPIDGTEARLLQVILDEPLPIDEIGVQSGLPIDKVLATLSLMELKGLVCQMNGGNYMAVRERLASYLSGLDG